MITIDVRTNAAEVARALQGFERQTPFAVAKGINRLALRGQEAQRKHRREVFNLTRVQFAERSVKIRPFATKAKPEAVIREEPPGSTGENPADIFGKFEAGGTKRSSRSGGSVAIPAEGKGKRRRKRPSDFNFRRVGSGPGGQVFVGDDGAFMVKSPGGRGGVFIRKGRKVKGQRRAAKSIMASDIATRKERDMTVRTLYVFAPGVPIDKRLEFVPTITREVQQNAAEEFRAAVEEAIRTAKR